MTQPIYAIGDIHGQLDMLEDALKRIERDGGSDAPIIFLGDYVDRGPNSRAVLDRLIEGKSTGKPWRFLKGNHDRMFEWFLEDVPRHDPHLLIGFHWLHERIGGRETLASYGIEHRDQERLEGLHARSLPCIPESHKLFLKACEISVTLGNLFFCHAGIKPGVPLSEQKERDLLWIRKEFHDDHSDHGALIVHGHTPVEAPQHAGNRVNLDTGAGYGKPLTAACFDGSNTYVLSDTGRIPLKPTKAAD